MSGLRTTSTVVCLIGLFACSWLSGCATLATPYQQARDHHASGRLDEAIAAYYQALQEDPNRVEIQVGLAEALAAKSLWDDSLHALERAHRLAPKDEGLKRRLAESYFEHGKRQRQAGRISDAYADWKRVLDLQPGHPAASEEIGKLYAGGEGAGPQPTGAAAEAADHPAEPHRVQGTAFFKQGQHEQAAAEFQQAIRLDPNDAKTYNNLGNVYLKMGRLEEAHAAFERSVRLDPNQAVVHGNWGTAYFQQGRYQRAREEWETALRLDLDNETARQNLETLDSLGY